MLSGVLLSAGGCSVRGDAPPGTAPGPSGSTTSTAGPGWPTDAPPRRTFHKAADQPYRFENSFRGLAFAAAHGYRWIDVDSNYCWDDTHRHPIALATHWPRIDKEGFDPGGLHPPATTWADLTLSGVRRLATADARPYRVATMVAMVRRAARLGLTGIEWEVKPGAAFADPATYRPVLRVARRVGLALEVKTVHGLGGVRASLARLRAAKAAGARTMLLSLGEEPVRVSRRQASYVDVVRGPWRPAD